jgi:RHH-type rel operon transcriptional repressor/antitoxin RelB
VVDPSDSIKKLIYKIYLYSKLGAAMLALRLPEDIETRLDKLAKATGRTKSFYAREAILEHLADLEDLYLAEKRLAKVRNGKSKTYTLNAVEQELGLAN